MALNAILYPQLIKGVRLPGAQALPPQAVQAPASNTNAVLTLPAVIDPQAPAGQTGALGAWYVAWIGWSYTGGTPTGSLTINWTDPTANAAGSVTETYAGLITQGFGQTYWPVPRRFGNANTAVVITLTAGGTGVVGTVYTIAWTEY